MIRAGLAFVLVCIAPAALSAGSAANRYFEVVDTDRDGRISLPEYLDRMTWAFRREHAIAVRIHAPEEQLAPNSPRLTRADLEARLQGQFRRQDRNRDGTLDPAEFLAPPA